MMKRKGITFLEYGLLIVLVIGALVIMRVYFQRAVQGKWKENADRFGHGLQFEGTMATGGH